MDSADKLYPGLLPGPRLTHHGVKGMHWGVRKEGTGTPSAHKAETGTATAVKRPRAPSVSADAKQVDRLHQRVEKGGTDTLSNRELQTAISRMNLQQQYERLTAEQSRVDAGGEAVDKLLKNIGRAQKAHKAYNSDLGKLVRENIKTAAHRIKKVADSPVTKAAAGVTLALL